MASDSPRPGQPTKYKPEYCEMLLTHMTQGKSFNSFAGLVDVSRETLYEWDRVHPEFSDTKKRAFEKSRLYWEEAGLKGLWENPGDAKFNTTNYIFNMKNRFPDDWREKQEVQSTVTSTTEVKAHDDLKPLIELFTKVMQDK